MYGCYDAYIVYGICEGNSHLMLDSEILEELEEYNIHMYATEVIRNHMCEAVYGYYVSVDMTTGTLTAVPNKIKEVLEKLFDKLQAYHQDSKKPSLGYFTVVGGNYDTKEHSTYKPE